MVGKLDLVCLDEWVKPVLFASISCGAGCTLIWGVMSQVSVWLVLLEVSCIFRSLRTPVCERTVACGM